jgi:hypothetical protein
MLVCYSLTLVCLLCAVACFFSFPLMPQDDVQMASRGGDGTLKLWDLRAFKKPLAVWDGLDTNYANTTCCFSPDERLLCTGARSVSEGMGWRASPVLWCLCHGCRAGAYECFVLLAVL